MLGLYLGDGCISRCRRVWHLRITLDKKYPGVIDRCRATIDQLMPGQHASIYPQSKGCVVVSLYSKHWPCLLPQHGPGKKHLRPIRVVQRSSRALGIPWTRPGKYQVAICRKAAVARLDKFVGPKS